MKRKKEAVKHVFVIDQAEANAVIKDEIIAIGENRYKSIKFRHTYYRESDFMNSIDEVREYLKSKYGQIHLWDHLIS